MYLVRLFRHPSMPDIAGYQYLSTLDNPLKLNIEAFDFLFQSPLEKRYKKRVLFIRIQAFEDLSHLSGKPVNIIRQAILRLADRGSSEPGTTFITVMIVFKSHILFITM